MLTVGSVVIRVDDLAREVAFWTAALDYAAREPVADYIIMEDPEGNRFCVVAAG